MTTDPILTRRRALGLLAGAGAGAVVLAACGKSGSSDDGAATASTTGSTAGATSGSTTGTTDAASASCDTAIPEETAGPFPGDGSNGPDVLTQDGVVRRDITSSFGDARGTAAGVPLTIELTIVDTNNTCAPLSGAAVYAWHCDRDGRYSM
jgi:protocatechuate 3,4-dioxygenase beta subunit